MEKSVLGKMFHGGVYSFTIALLLFQSPHAGEGDRKSVLRYEDTRVKFLMFAKHNWGVSRGVIAGCAARRSR